MKHYLLKDFIGGWFIGDFEPSLMRTKNFEISVKSYKKGDIDIAHYHKIADEYTVIISGKYIINGKKFTDGSIIHFKPNDVSRFECIEAGTTTVIKVPSVPRDKYEYNK